jgi:NAD(P)-dependent dehydrogenase (short-subunit alcohol dehydrogenase family)
MGSKIAVVTGAGRGLGRSMALHLSRRGVGVVGTFRSENDDGFKSAAAEIEANGGRVAMLRLDVSLAADFRRFAAELSETLKKTFGRSDFDYLVNNAGNSAFAPVIQTSEEEFDFLIGVQFKGTLFLTQALLPMIADGGRILNVSSGTVHTVSPGLGVYAATKGAIEVLTRYLAAELGDRKIRVNAIAPGAIATDFGHGAVRDYPNINKRVASMTALGRVGQPDDIGAAVASILSDDFGWVNGARINISGGQGL